MKAALFQEFAPATTPKRVYVQNIRLERAEGPISECGTVKCGDFIEANHQLKQWAKTAPSLGYDKVDFTVYWEDGEEYSGRYDMTPTDQDYADLGRHMVSFLEFNTGEHCPGHLTQEQYENYFHHSKTDTQAFKDYLLRYHIPTFHTQETIDFHNKRRREAREQTERDEEARKRAAKKASPLYCDDRDSAIKRIRAGLKKRSGKTWSVTGGRGTAWGWIKIDAPPARRVWNWEGTEETGEGSDSGYMSLVERQELAKLLNIDSVSPQGESIPASGDYYQEYVDRSEGREPSRTGKPYWD